MSARASLPGGRSGGGPDDQTRGLREASAKKAKRARKAAEAGLTAVINSGREVNFATVARESGVSANYLRKQSDLAARIVELRRGWRSEVPSQPGSSENVESASMLSELTELRARCQKLERLLDAANAEIARLRRLGA